MDDLKPFWREQPLSDQENGLVRAMFAAHAASANRGNLSGDALVMAAVGSRSYAQAVAAAILTTGGLHAPIAQTMTFLLKPSEYRGWKVPGWGNSFIKGRKDDLWLEVDAIIERDFPVTGKVLSDITAAFHAQGKMIFPNPSAYTAATALVIGLPPELAGWLFIRGRLDAWTETIHQRRDLQTWAQP